jgi:hypothetical protein
VNDTLRIWYDAEGDYLEINLRAEPGYFEDTESAHVMRKINMAGQIIGYSILNVSSLRGAPLELSLPRSA